MTMKCWILVALGGLLVVVANARVDLGQVVCASCPAYSVYSETDTCVSGGNEYNGPLCKAVNYKLIWPDGAVTYKDDVFGFGQYDTPERCDECQVSRESQNQCWPAFYTPNAGGGSWSEVVYDQQADENIGLCNGDTCVNEAYIASVTCAETTERYYSATGTCAGSASLSPRPPLPGEACVRETAADLRHVPQSPGGTQRLEKDSQVFRTALGGAYAKDSAATLRYSQDQSGRSEGARDFSGAPLRSAQNSGTLADDFCPLNYGRSISKPGAPQRDKHGTRLSKQM